MTKRNRRVVIDIYSTTEKDRRGQLTTREPWFWNWHISEWVLEQIRKGKT